MRIITRIQSDGKTIIAIWNVDTLFAAGKLDNLIIIIIKSKGKLLHWSGISNSDRNHQQSVGILMDENMQKFSVKNSIPISESVLLI